MHPQIIHSDNFLQDALAIIERDADAAIFERGEFRIALSGGNTPRPVYSALAQRKESWDGWIFTFGDERCVPPEHPDSNYRMAKESLFDHASISPDQILRIEAELEPAEAAARYEQTLHERAGNEPIYRHDLLLLGMGDDGHTASLFPGTDALQETSKLVTSNFVPKFNTHRITMTYPLLNAARHVCFLVSGKGKESLLAEIFANPEAGYPCQDVQPETGNLTWIVNY